MVAYPDGKLLIDAIITLVVCEAAFLTLLQRLSGRGPAWASSVSNCLAGAGLLLALRATMAGAPFVLVAAALFAALIAHLADLGMRWRAADQGKERTARSSVVAPSRERSNVRQSHSPSR